MVKDSRYLFWSKINLKVKSTTVLAVFVVKIDQTPIFVVKRMLVYQHRPEKWLSSWVEIDQRFR